MTAPAGVVSLLRRYPVKSMLGEELAELTVDERGAAGDRRLALLDVATGRVASAKQPRLWRTLLKCSARVDGGDVLITLPDGQGVAATDADEALTALLGRDVRISGERPAGAEVERPDPVEVLAHGLDADVGYEILEISQGTPGTSFVDHSPLHVITTATLDAVGVEALRYRPNIVVETPPGTAPYGENAWLGGEVRLGGVRARATLPTPRCSVPTLEHGELGRAPQALRVPVAENVVDVEGFGTLPCAGVYLEVVDGGTVRLGEDVVIGRSDQS